LWSLQAKASSVHSRNSEQLEMAAVKCIFVSKVQKKSCHIRSWAKHMPTATAKPAPCSPQGAKHALLSAALAMSTLSPLQPALAATVFAGTYSDPNHPSCQRTIDESGVIRGVDPVPFSRGAGCSPGISATPWKIQGKVAPDDKSIFINFDEKDGSGEAFDGVYDKRRGGLLLPDGTLWKKVGKFQATSPVPGDYNDSSHPGCVRRILPTGTVQGEDPPGLMTPGSSCKPGDVTTPWELEGTIVGSQLVVNFDPIDKVKQGPILAVHEDNAVRTANGVWTRK